MYYLNQSNIFNVQPKTLSHIHVASLNIENQIKHKQL